MARTAQALAELSLDSADGAFLGAEEDLLARLGVSRPTLRQAAKIVENDRLVSVRRGTRGGFYATRPEAADAIRTLNRFLRLKGATLRDISLMNRPVWEDAVELAAGCADAVLRARLARFIETIDDHDSPGALIRADNELARLVAEMSGNPAIELVIAIGYSFGLEEKGVALFREPSQRAAARKLLHDLCRAILDQEGDVARVMAQRRSAAMMVWLDAALQEQPGPTTELIANITN
ncbi:MAG: FadR family transcriptional regulator [Caulobacteraceae bacterium]|nr:FadR family transcriptional regulator [Caulobacteraceae bacterium]